MFDAEKIVNYSTDPLTNFFKYNTNTWTLFTHSVPTHTQPTPTFTSCIMPDYSQELLLIRKAFTVASARIQILSQKGLGIKVKPDGSPVTDGDLEVNHIVQQILGNAYPNDGWLSEESPDNPSRLQKHRVWILDPIDGTKPFIKGLPQYTISLALIDRGQPALGLIFNPATLEYFCAIQGASATLNGQTIQVRTGHSSRMTFLVNPWQVSQDTLRGWRAATHCSPLLGSIAYSLALVAAGHVDGVINVSQQHEWDIAAALLLIQAAGGIVVDKHLKPIICNQPNPVVDGIIAARPDALPHIQELLKTLNR